MSTKPRPVKVRAANLERQGHRHPTELIEAADLVTEFDLVKHPFRDGVKAQKGVEF